MSRSTGNAASGRCALDLDAKEAEELAPLLLPLDTPAFGRAGRLRQMIFECAEATSFSLKYNNEMLVEVLAGGSASLAPGSTQPEGDLVQWCTGRSPQEYRAEESLLRAAADALPPSWPVRRCYYATGARWPGRACATTPRCNWPGRCCTVVGSLPRCARYCAACSWWLLILI